MTLAEYCQRQLLNYYFPWRASSAQPQSESSDTPEFNAAVSRYAAFRQRADSNLRQYDRAAGLEFLYVVLPALIEAGAVAEGIELRPDEESATLVREFVSSWRSAYQPFSLHDIAFKTLERRLFATVPVVAPSLELGVGNGYVSSFVFKGSRISVSSDPTLSVLEAKRYPHFEKLAAVDATAIPFADETFASIYMVHSIDHVRSREEVVREMARVIRPGGTLALSDLSDHAPQLMPLPEIYRAVGAHQLSKDVLNFYLSYAGESREFFTPQAYRDLLTNLGFEGIEIRYFLSPPLAHIVWTWFSLQLAMGRFDDQLALLRRSKFAAMRENFFAFAERVIAPLVADDAALCEKAGHGFNMFVTARKKGTMSTAAEPVLPGRAICPACRLGLSTSYVCSSCGRQYPVIEDIPLLVPFYADTYAQVREKAHSVKTRLFSLIQRETRKRPILFNSLRKIRNFLVRA